MTKNLPMTSAYLFTEMFGIRVESETKAKIKSLKSKGVDTPELLRQAIRDAVERAERELKAG